MAMAPTPHEKGNGIKGNGLSGNGLSGHGPAPYGSLGTTFSGNRLLERLARDELNRVLAVAEKIALAAGLEIYRQDGPMAHVYFPLSGICSLVVRLREGRQIEATNIGNEGMLGVLAGLGLDFSPITATQLVAGECLRLPTPALLQVMKSGGQLEGLLRRYAAFLLRNAHQCAACNVSHSVEERVCRWLLWSQDRVGKESFLLTHESLAEMLGVRRQTITGIAGALQAGGVVAYRRGMIQILDRAGLLACSCECYEVARSYYQRIVQVPA